MSHLSLSSQTVLGINASDFYFGEVLTVTHLLHVVLTTLELHDMNFLSATVAHNLKLEP